MPIIVGETSFAIAMSDKLLKRGVFVTGFGFPVVPEGTARIRTQLSAALTNDEMDRALAAFAAAGESLDVAGTYGKALFSVLGDECRANRPRSFKSPITTKKTDAKVALFTSAIDHRFGAGHHHARASGPSARR